MIWRRPRRRRSQSLLEYKQQAAIGIGKTIDQVKDEKHAHRVAVIKETRENVWRRDTQSRCCGYSRKTDEMHEVESRALLRGQPPETIFNTRNCIRVCRSMHKLLTAHEASIVYVDETEGCDKAVVFKGAKCDEGKSLKRPV